jgi:hypothetical protein
MKLTYLGPVQCPYTQIFGFMPMVIKKRMKHTFTRIGLRK